MKRFLILLTFCFSLASFSSFAQDLKGEVRGIETRVISSESYITWEIANYNKEAVSVDLYVYNFNTGGAPNKLVDTKSIILKPGEKYNFKTRYQGASLYLEYKAHIFTGNLPS